MKVKYAFFIIAIISLFFSCSDDDFSTSSSVSPLYFSADTIDMDTVFANIPTSTRTFWVYNRSESNVRLSSVRLAGGNQQGYRVNVDGTYLSSESGFQTSDLEVRKNDIQVEHPITEQVIDYDLIQEQILLAAGEKISGKNYLPKMHAIECRINAEDPYNDFRPSPGKITNLNIPGGHGVRVDTHVYAGYTIPSNYDSMIAKLIVTAQTREEAIAKMRRALEEFYIEGVKTTIPFHRQLMDNEDFIAGNYTTKFMESFVMDKAYENH